MPPWLAVTALAYAVLHHLGLLPDGIGDGPDSTRWADWLDLPSLAGAGAGRAHDPCSEASPRTWALFGAGAVAYVSGHGIHLAANSIGNADRGDTAHLWDEVVGHAIWYVGVALSSPRWPATMVGRPRPGRVGYLLAVAVGLTWATNMRGGGPCVLGVLVAVAACAFGWVTPRSCGVGLAGRVRAGGRVAGRRPLRGLRLAELR